jgi:hypothetical protein
MLNDNQKTLLAEAQAQVKQVPRHLGIHTVPANAIEECRSGGHVAHVTAAKYGRTVAIRPHNATKAYTSCVGYFDLTFSDPWLDLRKTGDEIKKVNDRQAESLIRTFLHGIYVDQDDGFDLFINQGERWCYVLPETATPTRVRIEYEMPNAGDVGSWCHAARLGRIFYLAV